MTGYELTRNCFNHAFENPDMTPHHIALYLWIVERANRSGWKEFIDLPTDFSMEATKIGSYKTYKKCLLDLQKWGFIQWTHKSRNQYQSNKVKLLRFEINTEALTKALQLHKELQNISSVNADQTYINNEKIKLLNYFFFLELNKSTKKKINSISEYQIKKLAENLNKLLENDFKHILSLDFSAKTNTKINGHENNPINRLYELEK